MNKPYMNPYEVQWIPNDSLWRNVGNKDTWLFFQSYSKLEDAIARCQKAKRRVVKDVDGKPYYLYRVWDNLNSLEVLVVEDGPQVV